MFRSLQLRWKILLPLLGLTIIPLAIVLPVISSLLDQQFQNQIRERLMNTAGFVERTIDQSQTELMNYIKLMAGNSSLINSVFYADVMGDKEQLRRAAVEYQSLFGIEVLEVLKNDGEILLRSSWQTDVQETSNREHPAIQAAMKEGEVSGIFIFDGRLAVMAVTTIPFKGDETGLLVGVDFLDDRFAEEIKSMTGEEIAFFDKTGLFTATHSELEALKMETVLNGDREEVNLGGKNHILFSHPLDGTSQGVLIAIDQSELVATRDRARTTLLLVMGVMTALAALVGVVTSRGITRPLTETVKNLKEIAEGEGDLTRTLKIHSRDETGELANSFNLFVSRLGEMVRRTRRVSADLGEAMEKIRGSSREVNEGTIRQSRSLEESLKALQEIERSVAGIAESTSTLVGAAEESSSATLELGATIEQIATQMEKLFEIVEEVSSAINETSVSGQQINDNVDILASSMEVTASSITQMDASIKEIEENAEKTNQFSEEAARDARLGKEAVVATIEGIGSIRETVDHAGKVIQNLGEKSEAIGKILTVIDEVADQTSLLALNAAIIAAQAGEHGRGFSVVADEIRELADRTAVSTREISDIIGDLQKGAREAVKAVRTGSERVNQEVVRSRTAGEALEKILSSTSRSTEQVRSIVRATQEQSRGSRQITSSINQVASLLDQIASAVKQQGDGNRQMVKAAEDMKEIASQGKSSTAEQAKGSRQIAASMEQIRAMIERIDEATREQTRSSTQVVEAVSAIRAIAESNAGRTAEMDQVVEILSRQAAALEEEVGAFKV